ncbi:class I SAM-dependent methyltransferase [Nocardia sp. NPDC060256]|uniref:class I SAM-dependent methyltransferase n=1 Tax=unclassified Nocardia TaxID=2637762 RepID=UPI003659A821
MRAEQETVMSVFDTLGDIYQRSATELPFREHLERYSMHRVVGDVTGLDVLDLGCGSGLYARRYAEAGAASVAGVDISEGMLATARAESSAGPATLEYFLRDAAHPAAAGDPLLDNRFDLVTAVYVLCYATTPTELAGFFATARAALHDSGRIVAMTLNPDYGLGRDYFARYGFTITQDADREGAPVTMGGTMPDGAQFSVTAYWWSRQAYEIAARASGFVNLRWTAPTVSAAGLAEYGEDYWAACLAAPHALILEGEVDAD